MGATREARSNSAIPCPYCGHKGNDVMDARPSGNAKRRRRKCWGCGLRWTTYEIIQRAPPPDYRTQAEQVIKAADTLLREVSLFAALVGASTDRRQPSLDFRNPFDSKGDSD